MPANDVKTCEQDHAKQSNAAMFDLGAHFNRVFGRGWWLGWSTARTGGTGYACVVDQDSPRTL